MPKTAKACICCVLYVLLAVSCFSQTAFAITAQLIGDYGDITVLEVEGNYDAVLANGTSNSAAREDISKLFYATHSDDYDFLVVITNFDFQMPSADAAAFYMGVQNDTLGIGRELFDYSFFFGSEGRLQGVIDMGNLANLASDPMDPNFSFTMGIMTHELVHRWAAFAKGPGPDNELLGPDGSHWSFLLDSDASLMYGNDWLDNGDGTFTSLEGRKYLSPLDQYLMGLIDKSEVPPMLLIDSPDVDPTQISKPGVTVSGAARTVTMEEIVSANGERVPDSTISQKDFKLGCIFITTPGSFTGEELFSIRSVMNNWAVWYSGLTNAKSKIEFREDPLESLPHNYGPSRPPHRPRETPAEVDDAVDWLIDRQEDDGNWSDTDATMERDTAAAVRVLKPFLRAEANVDLALQWIGLSEMEISTDYLARMIEALAIADAPVDDYLAELLDRQDGNGAWGSGRGYSSSTVDTALALRALVAAGHLDIPMLDEAVAYLVSRQNIDGGWGGSPHGSDIQTAANVLVALAPLRVAYQLNEAVQRGLNWLYGQQQQDGGFGETDSSVYATAAVLEVFKLYGTTADYYGPAIEYLQGTQSENGSWHYSVFETALAAEALYAWKDSVDADLVVMTSDIAFTPTTIAQSPETVTIDVTVHNIGLADADTFYVDLYEDTTDAGSRIDRQSIALAGQSSASVQFVVDFNDTRDHRLFVFADPENSVMETNETNNFALAVLRNDLNTDPDLVVSTDEMFFSPAGISQMPVEVTLEAQVHNAGLIDVDLATFALYQDRVEESAKIGERQIAAPALSSTVLTFSFTVTDGEAHQYFLVADPAEEIAERYEHNNMAIKLLTSAPAYDFGIRSQELTLSTATADMDEVVTISATIRNYGNRDGHQIPARFYIESGGLEYDLATLTFDLPAGGEIVQQVTWTANRAGTDIQVHVQIDPLDVFQEVSESNNSTSALLTVNPHPEPNLTLAHQDIQITPSPANKGGSTVISAQVSNNGGGPATDIQVDFAWGLPGETPVLLGSQTLGSLNPGDSAGVSWTIDNIDITGQRHITVTLDPANTILEYSEEDNSAFKELNILSLPDFIIHSSSILFNPAAPAEGEPVTITVTVQNAGQQEGQNVPVVIYEGDLQIAAGILSTVPGNSQAPISFDYDTTGGPGVRLFRVTVDPNHTIVEKRTDNNSTSRGLGVQNGDLWLSQRYIAADGNPDQASTTFFFRLDQPTDVQVVVVNARERIVRTFSGDELLQTTGASITWDGRDDRGQFVADGEYQIQVRGVDGGLMLSLPVSVDNNLSSLAEAVGTEYLAINNITCLLPQISQMQWFSDESGIVFHLGIPDDDAAEYPTGIYTMGPDGSGITRIVPWEWSIQANAEPGYNDYYQSVSGKRFHLASDDYQIAFVLQRREPDNQRYEIYTMNRFGHDRTHLDTIDWLKDGEYIGGSVEDMAWSANSAWLAYRTKTGSPATQHRIHVGRPDGTDNTTIDLPLDGYIDHDSFKWAPEGERLLYVHWSADESQFTVYTLDPLSQPQILLEQTAHDLKRIEWISGDKLVAVVEEDSEQETVLVLDVHDPQSPVEALRPELLDKIASLQVHPFGDGFAMIYERHVEGEGDGYGGYGGYGGPGDDYGWPDDGYGGYGGYGGSESSDWEDQDGYWSVQYCDLEGQCQALHIARAFPNFTSLTDLQWSLEGYKLAVVDWVNREIEPCKYQSRLVVMDMDSGEKTDLPATAADTYQFPCSVSAEVPMSYHVWAPKDGLWLEKGVLHYGSSFTTQSLPLGALSVDDNGDGQLRIEQVGSDEAHVDYVALTFQGDTFVPYQATRLSTGADILGSVRVQDDISADVTGESIELAWSGLPSGQPLTLQLHANEILYGASGTPDSSDDGSLASPSEEEAGPNRIASGTLRWLHGSEWLVGINRDGADNEDVFAINDETRKTVYFPIETTRFDLSPRTRYLTYRQPVPSDSICYRRGTQDYWVVKSLLNLTADLKVIRKASYLELKGTATDLNFDHYILEYADLDSPDEWQQIQPPKERMVVDDAMAQWVPPYRGTFAVRLTVVDKAGHVATKKRRISWGLESTVVNLYIDEDYISPNGDGDNDYLNLHYTVLEPMHLEIYVFDRADDRLVTTLYRDYAAVPDDGFADTVLWDGRDEYGVTVPDGIYRVEVLDHEFVIVLDNTPPNTILELSDIKVTATWHSTNPALREETEITALLDGVVADSNLSGWELETGTGENPLEWYEYLTGERSFGTYHNIRPDLATIRTLQEDAVGLAAGKKFRISAEDWAGNKSAATSEVLEELLVLYQWYDPDERVEPGWRWTDLYVNRQEDGSFSWPKFILSLHMLNSDVHRVKALVSIKNPIDRIVLQCRHGRQWSDGLSVQNPLPGVKELTFDGELPDRRTINAVRLMAVDENDNIYYSNPVPTQQFWGLSCLSKAPMGNAVTLAIMPFEDLTYLQFKTEELDAQGILRENILFEYNQPPIPVGRSVEMAPPDKLRPGMKATLTGIGESGQYYSNGSDFRLEMCDDGEKDKEEEKGGILSYLTITDQRISRCGLQAGPIYINAVLSGKDPSELTRLSYDIYQLGDWQRYRSIDLTSEPWSNTIINPHALDDQGHHLYQEGEFSLRAVVEDIHGESITIDKMQVKKERGVITYQNAVVTIDRTPPQAVITTPAAGAVACPYVFPGEDGSIRFGVDVWAQLYDRWQDTFGPGGGGSYALYYTYDEYPEETDWIDALITDTRIVSGDRVQSRRLCTWDVTGVMDEMVTLRLMVTDGAGNTHCHDSRLFVDKPHALSANIDLKLFSPNGDGELDEVTVQYGIEEAVILNINVLRQDTGESIRTLAADIAHPGGSGEFIWDGLDDTGQPVADGIYTIRVTVVDSCANEQQIDIKYIEIDRTPPTARIDYPGATDIVSVITEVVGTATDRNFAFYQLTLLDEYEPEPVFAWDLVDRQVEAAILGRWNTYGAEGVRILKLTVRDTVGNVAEDTVRIDLNDRNNLIVELAAEPDFFSPNGDGRQDTVAIRYGLNTGLNENYNLSLEFVNGQDEPVQAFTLDNVSGGSGSFTWDGRDAQGQPAADGRYQARLLAALVDHPSVTHREQVTVTLDATAPEVVIDAPQDQAFVPAALTIQGTIADINMESYNLVLNGEDGEQEIESGQLSRRDAIFSVLPDLADGAYTLSGQARDLGQIETRVDVRFTVDKTPPEPTLESPLNQALFGGNQPEINVLGAIEEVNIDQWQLRYRLESAGPEDWTILVQGDTLPTSEVKHAWSVGPDDGVADSLYILSMYALDKAGWEREVTALVQVDNTSPQTAITAPVDTGFVTRPMAVTGTAADTNMEKYTVETATGECAQASKWSPMYQAETAVSDDTLANWVILPPDGDYCLRVLAEDAVGHSGETRIHVTVDTQPPAAPALTGEIEDSADVRLSWDGNNEPDLAGYNLYRNGLKLNSELLTYTGYLDASLEEGDYTYMVRAVDLAGWESEPSNIVTLKVDLTPPVTRIRVPEENAVVSDLVEIMGTAFSNDDFKEYRLYVGEGVDPSSWQFLDSSPLASAYGLLGQWDTIALTSGSQYSFRLEAEDVSGNVGTHQIVVTVDNQPPGSPVLISVQAQGATSNDIDAIWQENDEPDLAGYLLYRNNELVNVTGAAIGDLTPYLLAVTAYTDSDLADGIYEYFLLAMDTAGNLSDPSNAISVTVDTRAPQAAIVTPDSGHTFDRSFMIQAQCPDLDLANIQFQYKASADADWIDLNAAVTQSPYITYLNPETLGLSYGSYDLRAVASDLGGRTDSNPPAIVVTYRDITPPAVPIDLDAHVNGGTVTLTWTANTESDLAGYHIYDISQEDPVLLHTGLVTEATFIPPGGDDGLDDNAYRFQVFAVDTSDNSSAGSNIASALVYTPMLAQPFTPTATSDYTLFGQAMAGDQVELFSDTGGGALSRGVVSADDQGNFTFDISFSLGENHLTAVAADGQGNTSKVSEEVVVVHGLPPATPAGLEATVSDHDVSLTWNQNPETDLAGYVLYRNGESVNSETLVSGGAASASVYDSQAGRPRDDTNYTYWQCSPEDGAAWWQLQLPSGQMISRIELRWYNDFYAAGKYELQVWSGHVWIPVVKVMGNTRNLNTFDIQPNYVTDRIRLLLPTDGAQPDGATTVLLDEVRLWQANAIDDTSYLDQGLADGTHGYKLEAVNTLGMVSAPTEEVQADVGDVTPPPAPIDLSATANGSGIDLSWTQPDTPDLAGYRVYKQEQGQWRLLNEALLSTATHRDADLANGTFVYRVTAMDTVDNESDPSNEASAQVAVALPEQPITVTATPLPQGGTIEVCWQTVDGAAGYYLYRSTAAGGPYDPVNAELITGTCFTDNGLVDGTTYYYMVHAVDSLGNESADSLEASALPADLIAPPAPVLFAPAVAGVPVTLNAPETTIDGWAEPGASVILFQDGIYEGAARASDDDNYWTFDYRFPSEDADHEYDWTASPGGRYVAYSVYDNNIGEHVCRIYDTDDQSWTTFGGNARNMVWSPDGTKLAFNAVSFDGINFNGTRVVIYDSQSGRQTFVSSSEAGFDEHMPSWSADSGRLVYISDQFLGTDQVCAYDLASGEVTQLVDAQQARYPLLSPDGGKLSYVVGGYPYFDLYMVDLQAGSVPVLVADDRLRGVEDDRPCTAWNAQSTLLAYRVEDSGATDIYTVDASGLTIEQLTAYGDVQYFAWSPDGRHIGYLRNDGSDSLWLEQPGATEPRQLADLPLDNRINGLVFSQQGQLSYRFSDYAVLVAPAGRFSIEGVPLSPGENTFSAVAEDAAGNLSTTSDAIVVNVDSEQLPDIEITASDLYHYPYVPIDGDQVQFSIVVHNNGFADAEDIQVSCYLLDSGENEELVHETVLDHLGAGDGKIVFFEWDSTGRAGRTTLIVEADPADTVFESHEYNNMALAEFYVAATEGLAMETSAEYDLYSANEDVHIAVELYNGAEQSDVTLAVSILDDRMTAVAQVEEISFVLQYSPLTRHGFTWNTERNPAGEYYVHTVLFDHSGQLAENLVPFSIEAALDVAAEVYTDRLHYDPYQSVQVHADVLNRTANRVLTDLEARIVLQNSGGETMHEHTARIGYLFGDNSAAVNTTWDTRTHPPGQYSVTFIVADEIEEIARTHSELFIDEMVRLGGAISVRPAVVKAGANASAVYEVSHYGNVPASGLPLAVALMETDGLGDLVVENTNADIELGGTDTGTFLFDTTGLDAGSYPVQLRSLTDEGVDILAEGTLTIQPEDQLPIQLSGSLEAEPETVLTGEPIILRYSVSNESGFSLDRITLSVSVPEGLSGQFERTISLPAGVTFTGTFVISTDLLIPATYTSALLVELTGGIGIAELARATYTVVEPGARVHSPVAMAGGPYFAAVGEPVEVDGGDSFDQDEGMSDSGTAPYDGIIDYRWEIHPVEPYDFDDAQGAKTQLPGYDTPGTHTIVLQVTDNTEEAFPSEGLPNLTDTDTTEVEVYTRTIEDLSARPKLIKCQLQWTHIGADEYEILRSEVGPSSGFETIAWTSSTYSTYLDEPIEMSKDYWYRVRCVIGEEAWTSLAVHVYSRPRTRR